MSGNGTPGAGDAADKHASTPRAETPALQTPDFAKHKDLFVVKADKVPGADPKVSEMLHGMQIVDGQGKPLTTNPDAPVHLTINDNKVSLDTGAEGSAKLIFPDNAVFSEGPNSTTDAGALTAPEQLNNDWLKKLRTAPKLDTQLKYEPPPPSGGVRG